MKTEVARYPATMTTFRAKTPHAQTLALAADWLAIGAAVSLPWSTTATGILIAFWLLVSLATLNIAAVRREITSLAGGLPVLLWLFAAIGMLWANVTWVQRIDGLGGYYRLLAIPLLLAQFRRSDQGARLLCGFLASAACLMAVSWVTAIVPSLAIPGKPPGVPVKDYVLQSGIFLLCAVAAIAAACEFWRAHNKRAALALSSLAALFLADIGFVITSRTTILVAPFLLAMLGWRQLRLKGLIGGSLISIALAGGLWLTSPHLRDRMLNSMHELHAYFINPDISSTALHLEFLRESVGIVKAAPVFGHGTGSIAEQFRLETAGQTGVSSIATVNPHNQLFAVAIELGAAGAIILLTMWIAHVILFRRGDLISFIGALVVVQNIVSSTANSHLFDFSEGWIYVFGVGVAGGMVLREQTAESKQRAAEPAGGISVRRQASATTAPPEPL